MHKSCGTCWFGVSWCRLPTGTGKPSGITSIMRDYKRQKEAPVGAAPVSCLPRVTAYTEEVAEGEVITMLGF